jgi:hypothetical protein
MWCECVSLSFQALVLVYTTHSTQYASDSEGLDDRAGRQDQLNIGLVYYVIVLIPMIVHYELPHSTMLLP